MKGVAAVASVPGPVPEVGAGGGPRLWRGWGGFGAVTELKSLLRPPWSHRRQITMSPGREVEEAAQMCVRLHICPQQNLWALFVFVCVRVCMPVLVRAQPAVCLRLSLSPCVSAPLSLGVWLLVNACCMTVSGSVYVGDTVCP